MLTVCLSDDGRVFHRAVIQAPEGGLRVDNESGQWCSRLDGRRVPVSPYVAWALERAVLRAERVGHGASLGFLDAELAR